MAVWSWLLLALFLGVCVLMLWLSRRIEPHWVSKDGQQFTCRVAELHTERGEVGRWNEARVAVNADEALTVAAKPKLIRMPGRHTPLRIVRVKGRAESDRNGLLVYLLTGPDGQMALRVPRKSRAVATLDGLADEDRPGNRAANEG
jgi:hypothetical protein